MPRIVRVVLTGISLLECEDLRIRPGVSALNPRSIACQALCMPVVSREALAAGLSTWPQVF